MQLNRNLLVRKLDPPQSWNPRVENYLRATGFYHVSRIGMIRGSHSLLAALVERWRPETPTFVLPAGEVTVTLEDVAHIFGLPIDGEPVSGWTDSSNKSTAYAHAKYLPLLRDFERIHTYSWGSGCLAHLYRALCGASRYDTREMDGPLNLLFVWTWERMPCISPVPRHILPPAEIPVAMRWSHSKRSTAWLEKTVVTFRHDIDYMQEGVDSGVGQQAKHSTPGSTPPSDMGLHTDPGVSGLVHALIRTYVEIVGGLIIERIQDSLSNNGDENKRIIYLGDGSGDYCPSLRLRERDFMMPRKNFPVCYLICKDPLLLKAEIHPWSDGQELEQVLLQLINKITSLGDESSQQFISSDCKMQTLSVTTHEALPKKPTSQSGVVSSPPQARATATTSSPAASQLSKLLQHSKFICQILTPNLS
ncbi:hypothetical protein AHAS_Ahas19G0049200 [Arachis hypogaea]